LKILFTPTFEKEVSKINTQQAARWLGRYDDAVFRPITALHDSLMTIG